MGWATSGATSVNRVPGCWADGSDPLLADYHDAEWGRPVTDTRGLYERLCLEGFQSGLSWRTVLAKRPAFRQVFAGFAPPAVAAFGPDDIERAMLDARIVRNRRKIEATVANARAVLALDEPLPALIWSAAPAPGPAPVSLNHVPASSPESVALARDLRRRGFAFVGPTTVYALMQACGLVNDHLASCPVRAEVEAERRAVASPTG